MRDLHDGLGGHLVSALALVEHGDNNDAVEETLRDALEDLRLVIESLAPDSDDLPVLLGVVRMRTESRMSRHGIRFDWQVREIRRCRASDRRRVSRFCGSFRKRS